MKKKLTKSRENCSNCKEEEDEENERKNRIFGQPKRKQPNQSNRIK